MMTVGPVRERKKEEDGYLRVVDKAKNKGARKSRGGQC